MELPRRLRIQTHPGGAAPALVAVIILHEAGSELGVRGQMAGEVEAGGRGTARRIRVSPLSEERGNSAAAHLLLDLRAQRVQRLRRSLRPRLARALLTERQPGGVRGDHGELVGDAGLLVPLLR